MAFIPKSEEEFKQLLLTPNSFVLVQFSASWCGPCKKITPTVKKLVKNTSNLTWAYIDIDENEDIANRFGISSVPLFLWYYNNEQIGKVMSANVEEFTRVFHECCEKVISQ